MSSIRGNGHLSRRGIECNDIRNIITRRRIQILVHSCLYYDMDEPIIQDHVFDQWSQELVILQNKYPDIAKHCDYAKAFSDFDGSTGFDLPHHNLEIVNKARYILSLHRNSLKKVVVKKHCKKKKHVIYCKCSNNKNNNKKRKKEIKNGKSKISRRIRH